MILRVVINKTKLDTLPVYINTVSIRETELMVKCPTVKDLTGIAEIYRLPNFIEKFDLIKYKTVPCIICYTMNCRTVHQ